VKKNASKKDDNPSVHPAGTGRRYPVYAFSGSGKNKRNRPSVITVLESSTTTARTLSVIPVVYLIFERYQERKGKKQPG
ncbi:MAG: hypothetical protein LBI85_06640, partial [Spirochaetaceae bacterium]|nr:hypothetical protein [Spirochaetaceae bacterium]